MSNEPNDTDIAPADVEPAGEGEKSLSEVIRSLDPVSAEILLAIVDR